MEQDKILKITILLMNETISLVTRCTAVDFVGTEELFAKSSHCHEGDV